MLRAIRLIYPDIQPGQVMLQDDGEGPYIKEWYYPQPQPTQEQVISAINEISSKPPIPYRVSMKQARLALLQSGLLDDVEAALTAMTGDSGRAAKIEWEFSQFVERDNLLVQTLSQALSLTEQQTDELFILAATL